MQRLLRFSFVGVINTVVDIAAFLILTNAAIAILPATIISTTLGIISGLILHHKFTFEGSELSKKRRLLFFGVTIIGLWAIQPPIIWAVSSLAATIMNNTLALLSAKIIATGVTFIWNYVLYSKIIFTPVHQTDDTYTYTAVRRLGHHH